MTRLEQINPDDIPMLNAGFPKVGFTNPWCFVRELQGVRDSVQDMPTNVNH